MERLNKSLCNCNVLLNLVEKSLEADKENCHSPLYADLQALFDFIHYLRFKYIEELFCDYERGLLYISDINTLDAELDEVEKKYFDLFTVD